MLRTPWDQRFFSSTRGQLLRSLRRGAQTVDDLAGALDLTDNAVRAQLVILERDGLVREAGVRRTPGSRKPSQVYELTSAADRLFAKSYDRVLLRFLGVVRERLTSTEAEAAIRDVGRRLADDFGEHVAGDARTRLGIAAQALNELGGQAEVVEADGALAIRGSDCPLAAVVAGYPETCLLAETLVSSVSGLAVRQRCERTGSPHCHFDVVTS